MIDTTTLIEANSLLDVINIITEDITLPEEPQEIDLLEEAVVTEKIVSGVSGAYLKVLSLIKDTENKWQGVTEVEVTTEMKNLLDNILSESSELADMFIRILNSDSNLSYEVKYETLLDNCKKFNDLYKKHNDNDKTQNYNIDKLHSHINKLKSKLKQSNEIVSESKLASKYRHAFYITVTRTIYCINKLLYGFGGEGVKKKYSDAKSGIISKRYGKGGYSLKFEKLNASDKVDLLDKLRKSTSYSAYQPLFDRICASYNKDNISAFKLIDLTKHNKLVFVGYSKLKPMKLPKGTKLYHISRLTNINEIKPQFKSKDNITFYSKPRAYFTDKLLNPKKVLPNLKDAKIYEYTCTKDTIAYRDSEYGAWYQHCLYIESNSPLKVTNITDSLKEDKKEKPLNESIELDSYSLFDIITEDVNSVVRIDDYKKAERDLKDVSNYYSKLDDDLKASKASSVLTVINNILHKILKVTGIEDITKGVKDVAGTKQVMRDLKKEMPMNHEIYNKIKFTLITKGMLKIISGLLLMILDILAIKVASNTVGTLLSKKLSTTATLVTSISNNATDVNVAKSCKQIIAILTGAGVVVGIDKATSVSE